MSHQTGITASDRLTNYLQSQSHLSDRCIKVVIENEELQLEQNRITVGNWESDWDRNVLAILEDNNPCYIFYRLDLKNEEDQYKYVFIQFMPNDAAVKDKMLYAATQATMKRTFGDNRIHDEVSASTTDEVSLQGYKNHERSKTMPSEHLMTEAEKELNEVSRNEALMRANMENNKATLPGLNLPVTTELQNNLEKFKKGFINYVQIKLDVDKEELKLWDCSNIQVTELSEKIVEDEPRYHLFNYNHNFEGQQLFSPVFVYSCPGYNVPVKQRMMYSSTKASFLGCLKEIGIDIQAKKEISEGSEVGENDIYDLVHPQKHVSRAHFVKPKAPTKGGRRLIR